VALARNIRRTALTARDPGERQSRPLLAIDTASAQGGIALYDGLMLSLRSWPAERSHTTTLLSEIHHLLSAADLAVGDLAAVAIAIGPGAFTGLRVGLSVAKGFHLATGVPLVGISTLEATALPLAVCGLPIIAAIAAGRGRLVWAHFESVAGQLTETVPPRNGTATELVDEARAADPFLITGELDTSQVELIRTLPHVSLPPSPLRIRQPAAFAELGWRRWQQGLPDDAAALEPIYLAR
jgi:tRNA threonylcarbamoyladenosine biosynthesis protein TsaB